MTTWLTDLRDAARYLIRHPGFTAVVVVTLAFGLAANTTIFSVVHGVLLRPLPYADPERLAMIWADLGEGAQSLPAVHLLDILDFRRQSRLFEDFAAAAPGQFVGVNGVLSGADGEPERVEIAAVTANFFPLLGVGTSMGRQFEPGEDVLGGPQVAILSHELWQRRYGGDRALLGRIIEIDGIGYEAVGILPAGFRLYLPPEAFQLRHADLWIPIQVDESAMPPRNYTAYTPFARLREGVSWQQAQAEMEAIAGELRATHAEHAASNLRLRVVPMHDDVVKGARPALLALFGAVGFVLLIVCANVASLTLVRGAARARELALRSALGAGRGRIVRRLLSESLLLAFLGGGLALLLARVGLTVLEWLRPADLPRLLDVRLDGRVLAFTAVIALLTAVSSGLAPAFRGARLDLSVILREGGRSAGSHDVHRWRSLLVIGQISISSVLLIGFGLMIRSFIELQQVRPGFDPQGAVTFRLDVPASHYPEPEQRQAFWEDLREKLDALAGVRSVGAVSQLPLTGSGSLNPYAYDAETARNWEQVTADGRVASPDYFSAMGIRLHAGRFFDSSDTEPDAPQRIIIDELLARRAFGDENPVGRRLQVRPAEAEEPFAEVVGVVEHVRMHDLAREVRAQMYRPLTASRRLSWVLRAELDPEVLMPQVRQLVAALDPRLPVTQLRPLTDYVDDAMAQLRFSLLLMSLFSGLALALACLGIYSVISQVVGQRRREFAIRLALGENPAALRHRVLRQGMRLLAVGGILGLAAATGLTRFLSEQLVRISPTDPATWAGVSLVLAAAALLACYLPARRAARVEPSALLRSE